LKGPKKAGNGTGRGIVAHLSIRGPKAGFQSREILCYRNAESETGEDERFVSEAPLEPWLNIRDRKGSAGRCEAKGIDIVAFSQRYQAPGLFFHRAELGQASCARDTVFSLREAP
jgi:hypothetical protein